MIASNAGRTPDQGGERYDLDRPDSGSPSSIASRRYILSKRPIMKEPERYVIRDRSHPPEVAGRESMTQASPVLDHPKEGGSGDGTDAPPFLIEDPMDGDLPLVAGPPGS